MKQGTEWKLIVTIALFPFVLVFLVLMYYQFDEELRPEVVEIINYKPDKIASGDNGYYALLGLFVSEEEDPHAKGIQMVSEAKNKYEEPGYEDIVVTSDIEGALEIYPMLDSEVICGSFSEQSCLNDIVNRNRFYTKLINDNEMLIYRLRNLYKFIYFQESSYLIALTHVGDVHKVVLSDIALKWASGNHEAALYSLRDDLSLWRRLASDDVSLLTRMIALRFVERDFLLLSEFISDCSKCINNKSIEKILKTFSSQEIDISKAIGFEFRYMHDSIRRGIEHSASESRWVKITINTVFKENSVLNKMYEMYSHTIILSKCEIERYLDCYADFKSNVGKEIDYSSIEFIKDPLGELLVKIAEPAYDQYVWVSHRQEIIRRLVYAKYMLYRDNISEDNVVMYLKKLPEMLSNPFTSQSIEWDSETRKLGMTMPVELQLEPESIYY